MSFTRVQTNTCSISYIIILQTIASDAEPKYILEMYKNV